MGLFPRPHVQAGGTHPCTRYKTEFALILTSLRSGFRRLQVCIATNKRTREKVIVKELKESDHEAQVAFIHEVALLKCIEHPNLLLFLGLFVAKSTDADETLCTITSTSA